MDNIADGLTVTTDKMISALSCTTCGALVGVTRDRRLVGCEHYAVTTIFVRDLVTKKLETLAFVHDEGGNVYVADGYVPQSENGR